MKAKQTMIIQPHPDNIWLCRVCDTVIAKQPLSTGEKAFCPECRHKLAEKNGCSLWIVLIIACIGLLLIIPASVLPLMHMRLFSVATDHSIISGITSFVQQGMWIPAVLISLGIIGIPSLYFILMIILLSFMVLNSYHTWLMKLLHLLQCIRNQSMLEIYLSGLIIAMVKLNGIGSVYPGFGLIIFIGLIIFQLLSLLLITPYTLWEKLEWMQNETHSISRFSNHQTNGKTGKT